jgi:hypothetical protein
MTSAARASNPPGTLRPSAFAIRNRFRDIRLGQLGSFGA